MTSKLYNAFCECGLGHKAEVLCTTYLDNTGKSVKKQGLGYYLAIVENCNQSDPRFNNAFDNLRARILKPLNRMDRDTSNKLIDAINAVLHEKSLSFRWRDSVALYGDRIREETRIVRKDLALTI